MISTIIYSLKTSKCIQGKIRYILMMKVMDKTARNAYPRGIIL